MTSKLNAFVRANGKGIALLVVMVLGAAFPGAHTLSALLQYFLIGLLFFAFLEVPFPPRSFHLSILWVLLANIAVAFIGYGLFSSSDITLALTAFFTGIAPSAIASPVVISFLEGKVEYALTAVLFTNVTTAVLVPLALPSLVGSVVSISVWEVLQPTAIVVFVPFILSRLVRRLPTGARSAAQKGKQFSFLLWLICLFIISAKASDFIRGGHSGSAAILLNIALVSLGICVINFALGAWIGGRQYRREASQVLGQKNLAFVIWIALAFVNPLVAMGPTFYILYHNLYNSWLIYRFEKGRAARLYPPG
jgi:BASS family bile acid:Na+ symporter